MIGPCVVPEPRALAVSWRFVTVAGSCSWLFVCRTWPRLADSGEPLLPLAWALRLTVGVQKVVPHSGQRPPYVLGRHSVALFTGVCSGSLRTRRSCRPLRRVFQRSDLHRRSPMRRWDRRWPRRGPGRADRPRRSTGNTAERAWAGFREYTRPPRLEYRQILLRVSRRTSPDSRRTTVNEIPSVPTPVCGSVGTTSLLPGKILHYRVTGPTQPGS
jgi:hypothetical protein